MSIIYENDINETKKYYTGLVEKYGADSNRAGSWGGVPQDFRYRALVENGVFENAEILEIGCGTGGFLEYLIKNNIIKNGDYCGIDIVEKIQKINEAKFPQYHFDTIDILNHTMDKTYDVVVLCGVFNYKTKNGDAYMKKLLIESFKYCRNVLCFNFVSSYVNYREDNMEYHDPEDILGFLLNNLSKKVDMRHHYSKCDVCCHVYK